MRLHSSLDRHLARECSSLWLRSATVGCSKHHPRRGTDLNTEIIALHFPDKQEHKELLFWRPSKGVGIFPPHLKLWDQKVCSLPREAQKTQKTHTHTHTRTHTHTHTLPYWPGHVAEISGLPWTLRSGPRWKYSLQGLCNS